MPLDLGKYIDFAQGVKYNKYCLNHEGGSYDEKEYALDHPNDIVGVKYYFEGIFTHYNNGYGTRKAEVICINGSWFVKQIY